MSLGRSCPSVLWQKLTHRLAPDAIFHTDAVQGFLKLPFQAKTLGADLISVSSHKVHGPKGAGGVVHPPGTALATASSGGRSGGRLSQRHRGHARPGGLRGPPAAALPTLREDLAREAALRDRCAALLEAIPGVELLGAREAPHILLASIPGVPTQNTINILQDHGVCVSAGSACAKGHRSHVLEAMGLPPEVVDGAFRISPQPFYRRRRAGAAGGWAARRGGAYAGVHKPSKTRGCLKTNFETTSCLSFQKAVFHLHPVQLFQHGLGQEPEEEKGGGSVDQVRRQTG